MKTMSIVLPAYNEEQMIEKTAGTIARLMENEDISYELVFVNDGSKDQTWERIKEASKKNSNIKGICFPEILGKKEPCLRDSPMPPETVWQSWTAISSILRRLLSQCTGFGNRVIR